MQIISLFVATQHKGETGQLVKLHMQETHTHNDKNLNQDLLELYFKYTLTKI